MPEELKRENCASPTDDPAETWLSLAGETMNPWKRPNSSSPPLTIPACYGRLTVFLDELRDELRNEVRVVGRGPSTSRTPSAAVVDQLGAGKTMRLGVMNGRRLIAVAAVDNDGSVALAVLPEYRRRGVANQLMRVVTERAAAIGYPPLHRFMAPSARLAG